MKMAIQKRSGVTLTQIPHDAEFVRGAVIDALKTADVAAQKMILCGQLFREVKAAVGYSNWLPWLDKNLPEISQDRAERWMKAAENVLKFLELPVIDIPMSQVLSLPDAELSAPAREAKQLFFDFTADKTINDCIRCVFEGDEPHRITRAHNGKTKGGSKGENRKDFPKFIANKLSDVSTHLESWDSMTAAQRSAIHDHFEMVLGKWPTPVLEKLRDQIKKEMQKR